MFVPLMGRIGTALHPDIFLAVVCALGVLLLFGYQVSRTLAFGDFFLNTNKCRYSVLSSEMVIGKVTRTLPFDFDIICLKQRT